MSKLVMALLIAQILGGAYQFSFLLGVGAHTTGVRASRLPDAGVFTHAVLGFVAAGLWVAWLFSGEVVYAWATLGSLLLSVVGGLFMYARTAGRPETIEAPVTAAAGVAGVPVAEKQIPGVALLGHGMLAAVLVVGVLLVALTA